MKTKIQKIYTAHILRRPQNHSLSIVHVVALLIVAGLWFLSGSALAGNVSMRYEVDSPVSQEGDFTVSVLLDLGNESANDAVVTVNFDSTKLQYISSSYESGATAGPDDGISADSYQVDALFLEGPKTGTVKVIDMSFRVLASGGSTTLRMTNPSVADSGSDATPGSTHTVTTDDTTITLEDESTEQDQSGLPTEEEVQTNAQLDDDQPVPVTEYDVFDDTTYIVAIEIRKPDGSVVKGTPVSIGQLAIKTDENGVAEFTGLRAGIYNVDYLGQSTTIDVQPGDPLIGQEFVLTDSEESSLGVVVILAIIVGLLAGAAFFAQRYFRKGTKSVSSTENKTS